jgi:hypothetical protein
MYRIVLAALIALAVALAPIGSALAASAALAKAAMADCHGKAAKDHSCCDAMAKCPDACGIKCCKLMGIVADLPPVVATADVALEMIDPQKPPDWQLRPRPPPPRT